MTAHTNDDHTTEVRRRIFQIKRLSAMPQVVFELMNALEDKRTDAARIEKIIESDQALASKVLSLSNSAYYSRAQKITTIKRSIVVIGFEELQLLAFGTGLAEVFNLRKAPTGFDGEGLWLHCLAVSWMARELAELTNQPNAAEIMLSGLLHDLGKLILATHLKDDLAEIMKRTDKGMPYYEAEREAGMLHSVVGYLLAINWRFPDVLVSAIRYHHAPQDTEPSYKATCLVSLADLLVKKLGVGLVQESVPVKQAAILSETKITIEQLKKVTQKAKKQIPPMLDMWRSMLD